MWCTYARILQQTLLLSRRMQGKEGEKQEDFLSEGRVFSRNERTKDFDRR